MHRPLIGARRYKCGLGLPDRSLPRSMKAVDANERQDESWSNLGGAMRLLRLQRGQTTCKVNHDPGRDMCFRTELNNTDKWLKYTLWSHMKLARFRRRRRRRPGMEDKTLTLTPAMSAMTNHDSTQPVQPPSNADLGIIPNELPPLVSPTAVKVSGFGCLRSRTLPNHWGVA